MREMLCRHMQAHPARTPAPTLLPEEKALVRERLQFFVRTYKSGPLPAPPSLLHRALDTVVAVFRVKPVVVEEDPSQRVL